MTNQTPQSTKIIRTQKPSVLKTQAKGLLPLYQGVVRVFENEVFLWSEISKIKRQYKSDAYQDALNMVADMQDTYWNDEMPYSARAS